MFHTFLWFHPVKERRIRFAPVATSNLSSFASAAIPVDSTTFPPSLAAILIAELRSYLLLFKIAFIQLGRPLLTTRILRQRTEVSRVKRYEFPGVKGGIGHYAFERLPKLVLRSGGRLPGYLDSFFRIFHHMQPLYTYT